MRNQTADRLVREGMSYYADEALPKILSPQNIEVMPDMAGHVRHDEEHLAGRRCGSGSGPGRTSRLHPRAPVGGGADARRRQSRRIDGAAHMPNLERPAEFNSIMENFLRTLPAEAATEGHT